MFAASLLQTLTQPFVVWNYYVWILVVVSARVCFVTSMLILGWIFGLGLYSVILLDSLIFKIVTTPEKETALLAIPELCTDKIITLYHSSLFVGYQGVIKTYLTMNDKFFILNLIHYICSYIKDCQICQLAHNEKPPT